MARWSTLEILQQTTGELGLPRPDTLPTSSVQDNQLLALLNSAGAELVYAYPWTYLSRWWELTTTVGQDSYPLPDGWGYPLNQTAWDLDHQQPLHGPRTPQEWARVPQDVNIGSLRYRIAGHQLRLAPKPTIAGSLKIEYITDQWVQTDTEDYADRTDDDGDMPLHDAWLLVKYLKYKFLDLKKLATDASLQEFTTLLHTMIGKDRGGRVLTLTGSGGIRYIGSQSIPEGNWVP